MAQLERNVHEVLFPVEFEYAAYCESKGLDPKAKSIDRRWRNVKCDVLVAWSHIHHGGHILVTADDDLLRKDEALARLGAGRVLKPPQAVAAVSDMVHRGG